ncbi:MAG: ATP-dependent dethiobiotin synthetase BioD [Bacteroidales bacterium]|nr:ATP-dependent dethiobiotin synthetase BioD [Bacteroidales bacterium]
MSWKPGDRRGVVFVSGIDTDCGKTYVTAHLAAYYHSQGVRVITQKPVQTGCVGMAEDLEVHRRVMGTGLMAEDREGLTCSYLFPVPASPHLSARLAGSRIETSRMEGDTRRLAERYDMVLVEGAGGLMVPLNDDEMTIGYIARNKFPLILVATSKLGAINHTLLSVEVCQKFGVDLQLIVYNRLPGDDKVMADDAYSVVCREARKLYSGLRIVDYTGDGSFAEAGL